MAVKIMVETAHLIGNIAKNLERVQERVAQAASRVGRDATAVTIVGASKTVPPEAVAVAHGAGLRHFGENWVQEARSKQAQLPPLEPAPTWHLIGHLQTNKVSPALQLFDVIQTVDSVRLAEALARRAQRPVPAFLEVNVTGEATKSGFALEEVAHVARHILQLPELEVRGLMTVAPLASDPEAVRWVFRRLRELGAELGLRELSMGMTDDFEVAIEEGATFVRIGRAIFGERPVPVI